MKKITLITLIFLSILSFGQNDNDNIIFFDSLNQETNSDNYFFKKIIKDYYLEKSNYIVEKYSKNRNKDILVEKYSVNNKYYFTKDGEFKSFYKNGKVKQVLNYKNDTLSGLEKYFYENGKLSTEGYYKIVNKIPKYFLKNYWNKFGVQKVKNGNGYFEYYLDKNEKVLFSGEIKNEVFHGVWKSNNKVFPKYEKNYDNGVLINGKIIKSDSVVREYTGDYVSAKPKDGINIFRKKIATSIDTSEIDQNISGKIVVKFCIDEEGNITNVKIVESFYPLLNKQIILTISRFQKWESALENGVEVKQWFELPLAFDIRKENK